MAQRIPARLTAAEGRKFAFTVGVAFLVLAAVMLWRQHQVLLYVFGGLGGALLLAGLLVPAHLGPVNRAWMGLAHAMSKVTTPLFMGIVFFIVMAPVGLIMRLFGRNPIRQPLVNRSYWAARTDLRGGMKNQF